MVIEAHLWQIHKAVESVLSHFLLTAQWHLTRKSPCGSYIPESMEVDYIWVLTYVLLQGALKIYFLVQKV